MKKTFAAVVKRTESWDASREPHEQEGFAGHAAFVGALEADGFVAMAGLMQQSSDVLFIFFADSVDEVRQRMSQDPWQRDGRVRLDRVEEIQFRIGAPQQATGS
jgi:hypothetical protein